MQRKILGRIATGIAVALGLSLAAFVYLTTRYFSASELDLKPYPLRRIDLDLPQAKDGVEYYGKVRIDVFIDSDGAVERVEVVDSKVPGRIRDSAVSAFSHTRWEPGRKWGLRVKSLKVVEVDYEPPSGVLDRLK